MIEINLLIKLQKISNEILGGKNERIGNLNYEHYK